MVTVSGSPSTGNHVQRTSLAFLSRRGIRRDRPRVSTSPSVMPVVQVSLAPPDRPSGLLRSGFRRLSWPLSLEPAAPLGGGAAAPFDFVTPGSTVISGGSSCEVAPTTRPGPLFPGRSAERRRLGTCRLRRSPRLVRWRKLPARRDIGDGASTRPRGAGAGVGCGRLRTVMFATDGAPDCRIA